MALLDLSNETQIEESIVASVQTAYDTLLGKFNDYVANREVAIVDRSIRAFVNHVKPDLVSLDLLHNANAQPVEFEYGALRMMASPELAFLLEDYVWVISWKTGNSAFFDQHDASLKCAAANFWIRSRFQIVDRRVVYSDIYLSEGGNRKDTELADQELSAHLDEARRVADEYGRSSKIRDFPARPEHKTCRFCNFREVCPEFLAEKEEDYSPESLSASIVAETAPPPYIRRKVFLSHCSEDKESIVRPIARALEAVGIDYWLDEAEIRLGDSLSLAINKGLREADYVMCVISDSFLEKGWPEAELGGVLAMEFGGRGGRVLPLMATEFGRIVEEYPLLADKKMANFSDGISALVAELQALIRRDA